MEMGERQAIYQVSTLQALARGNYYGSTDMETLLTPGHTGLGTFHAVGGELIVIDGHAYRVLGDGSAVEAATSDTTPFATVTWLREQVPVILKRQPSIEALKDILTEQVRELGINDVYIVRIDGLPSATVLPADRWGRPLPSWQQCRLLNSGELFLLSVTNPASFDSRYFGPVNASAVLGVAHPVWLESRP